jgi:hypothetical protein
VTETSQVETEQRKAPRRSFRHSALVAGSDKSSIKPCSITDISETGAQLTLASTDNIPDKIILVLSKGGKVRRQCKVVWRAKNRIGVEFLERKETAAS